jgi:hypothetical protein
MDKNDASEMRNPKTPFKRGISGRPDPDHRSSVLTVIPAPQRNVPADPEVKILMAAGPSPVRITRGRRAAVESMLL